MPARIGVEVENFGLKDLFAAVGQELAGQAGGAFGGPVDFGSVIAERISLGKVAEHQFRLADDGGHDAVEFVGDAARQLADGFHFLGLKQAGFKAFALGDVQICPDYAADLPVGTAKRYFAGKNREGVAIGRRLGFFDQQLGEPLWMTWRSSARYFSA